jgi:hypothetical protein
LRVEAADKSANVWIAAMVEPILDTVFTIHAMAAMRRRRIDHASVEAMLLNPDHHWPARSGRDVPQGLVTEGKTTYQLRVFVDIDRSPPEVVTAYRTTKLTKYKALPS